MPVLQVPGGRPYRKVEAGQAVTPLTCETACTLCGSCAAVCPTAAITVADAVSTNVERCILCNACVNKCPSGARRLKVQWVRKAMAWLSTHCAERKEPETFWLGKE
ncbi:MAG: 4Fe-4S binding protein [Anaerolineae bacterium]